MLKLFINNKEYNIPSTMNILQACDFIGIQIPRFCFHEKLSIAGNCRMCLVELERSVKPVASCAMTVTSGMHIWTNTALVYKAREGVMEFLLANHPLDCPICDQGGECDLQDQALLFGNDRGRFYERKRAVSNKNCGPFIKTIMTRCIHCTRCVRFSKELSGNFELVTTGRGVKTEIGNYVSNMVLSEVSGNLIDLCPVGALTSKPYAFTARSWELKQTESIDTLDSMCSNIRIYTNGRRIMRILPILHEDLNEEWINDRTRFSYDGYFKQRIIEPYIAKSAVLKKSTWRDSLNSFSLLSSPLYLKQRGYSIGNTLSLETLFSLKILTSKIEAGVRIGELYGQRLIDFRAYYLFNDTFGEISNCDVCLILGSNLKLEMPLLLIRLRREQRKRELFVSSFGIKETYGLQLNNLGNSIFKVLEFVEGRNRFCSLMLHGKKSSIIVGSSILDSIWSDIILKNLLVLKSYLIFNNKLKIHFLHNNVGMINFCELGLGGDIIQSSLDVLNNIEAPEIETKVQKINYIGSHGASRLRKYDLILPASTAVESDSLYTNAAGYVQLNKFIFKGPYNSYPLWKISFLCLNIIQKKGFVEEVGITTLRNRILNYLPVTMNEKSQQTFYCIPILKKEKIKNNLIMNTLESFYRCNTITRASRYLAEADELYKKKRCQNYC